MNKKEPSWLSARIDALIAERDAAISFALSITLSNCLLYT